MPETERKLVFVAVAFLVVCVFIGKQIKAIEGRVENIETNGIASANEASSVYFLTNTSSQTGFLKLSNSIAFLLDGKPQFTMFENRYCHFPTNVQWRMTSSAFIVTMPNPK